MTHYSHAQSPDKLAAWAKKAATKLAKRYPQRGKNYPVLVYSGMSGIASATALMLALHARRYTKYGMAYVRKPDEYSHGNEVEHERAQYVTLRSGSNKHAVFVDDFIGSGDTMRRCREATEHEFSLFWGNEGGQPRLVLLSNRNREYE